MADKRKRVSGAVAEQPETPRGRPPMLSSEAIISVALELLRKHPRDEFTTARVARELGVSPPALSRYFPSRAALLDAMATTVFAEFPDVPANGDWREKLGAWQHNLVRHYRKYRGMMHLMSWDGKLSGPWLRVQMPVISLLHDLGFSGRALFETSSWFLSGTVGMIRTYLAADYPDFELSELLDFTAGSEQLTPAQKMLIKEAQKWVGKTDPDRVLGTGLLTLVDGVEKELRKLGQQNA